MFGDIEVLWSRNRECGLNGNRLVGWSGILLWLPCFTGISMRCITALIFPESSPLYEGLNSIFEVDTIFSQVSMASMVLAVFALICPGLSRSRARILDTSVLKICVYTLRQNMLAGSRYQSALSTPPRGSSLLARVSGFVVHSLLSSSSRRAGVLLRISG